MKTNDLTGSKGWDQGCKMPRPSRFSTREMNEGREQQCVCIIYPSLPPWPRDPCVSGVLPTCWPSKTPRTQPWGMRLRLVCRTGRRPLCCWPKTSCVVKSTSWNFERTFKNAGFGGKKEKKKKRCLSTGNVGKGFGLSATRGLSRAGQFSPTIWNCWNVSRPKTNRNDILRGTLFVKICQWFSVQVENN